MSTYQNKMPNWPTQFLTFMGVGTQCRRSLSPFPVGLLPPKIGCGLLVWCVWCGVCVQLVVAHNIAKCIGFPYGCWLWQKKPDAPAPRDKKRVKMENVRYLCNLCVAWFQLPATWLTVLMVWIIWSTCKSSLFITLYEPKIARLIAM